MFRFIAAVSLATLLALPTTASADSFIVDLGDDMIRTARRDGVHVGDLELLGVWPVPAELVGLECDLSATSMNVTNPSVHPDNDLIVASAISVELLDVEREAGAVTYPSGPITLGESLSITLRMGPDERFSAGLRLEFTCQPTTTTTTTTTLPGTTTTTTLPGTTTTTTLPETTTTTTTLPGTTTTTTLPETTTTTTTTTPLLTTTTSVDQAGPTTTTTPVPTTTSVGQAGPTSTVGPGAATTTVAVSGQLPVTGRGSLSLTTIAVALVGIGAVMWRLSSKPAR